jgi:4-aminobutyrate aminotransferase-like enzyme
MSFKIYNHIPKVIKKLNNIIVQSGKGCWVTDIHNKKYLDMTSGIGALSTGHSHPLLTEKLVSIMPSGLDTFFMLTVDLKQPITLLK